MATIYELVTPKPIAQKWDENYLQREPYLGEALFTERKQLSDEISYLESKAPAVRPLNLSSYDAKVISLGREGLNTKITTMPFFKNELKINEKLRKRLNEVIASGNEVLINAVLNDIYNDNQRLFEAAAITREMMRMQLLTTGTIIIANNGESYEYDFGVPAENKVNANWHNAATSKPVKDLNKWASDVQNATGVRPAIVLMNSTTLETMSESDSIKNAMYVFANGTVDPDPIEAQDFVGRRARMRIVTYDKGYTPIGSDTFTKFIPDDVVVMLPAGAVGEGVFGTTPEESDLMTGATEAEVSIVDTGVALTAWKETDPVSVRLKASMNFLPVLNNAKTIVIADVSGNN